MKPLMISLSLAMMFGAFSQLSSADAINDIQLGHPNYGGNGCAQGTASTTLSPDKKSLSILFDEYMVEAQPGKIERSNCNIAIPVSVPQGFSVSVIEVDYRGYNFLPTRSRATFAAEYFFAGIKGPKLKETWRGPIDEDYEIDNNLLAVADVWSECGADVNLRVNTSMRVINKNRKEEALSTVDSADFKAGIVYHLAWKECKAH